MSWIDQDFAELERHRKTAAERAERESKIADEAERVYNDLWAEIAARIAEAKEKKVTGATLITNGSPYHRSIVINRSSGPREQYSLLLAANKQSIIFTRSKGESIILLLDFGEDGVVGIRREGETGWIGDVAKSLLRPLLFPELFDLKDGVRHL